MRKAFMLMAVLIFGFFLVDSAGATLFTMDATQLQSLYQTWEHPTSTPGTYLNPVQAIVGGAKYTGNVRTNDPGWGAIQIGANFWGKPYGGSAGDEATNVALGLDSLSGYDSYGLTFTNKNENSWMYQLNFNVGWTDSPYSEIDYYVQNTWTTISASDTETVVLDLTHADVWSSVAGHMGWVDLTDTTIYPAFALINWDHISNMGFQIGGNMPVGPLDYTYETLVRPVPEPATMLLLGAGLICFVGLGRKKFLKR